MNLPTNALPMLTKKVQIKSGATPDISTASFKVWDILWYSTLCNLDRSAVRARRYVRVKRFGCGTYYSVYMVKSKFLLKSNTCKQIKSNQIKSLATILLRSCNISFLFEDFESSRLYFKSQASETGKTDEGVFTKRSLTIP